MSDRTLLNVGPASKPSSKLTSSNPSSISDSSCDETSSFGDSGGLGSRPPVEAKNLASGCLGVSRSGFSLKVAEMVKQRSGSLKLSLRKAAFSQQPIAGDDR